MNARSRIPLLIAATEPAVSSASGISAQCGEEYFGGVPEAQNGIALFEGEWSSRFPQRFGIESGGHAGLFRDERIEWALARLKEQGQEISDARVLELGPLEAAHTTMLERAGARSITAIEANGRAFLKCLIVKEIMRLQRSIFLLGDALAELEGSDESYDLGVVSGFLYHMREPIRLIQLLSKSCRHLYIWTHYYDEEFVENHPEYRDQYDAPTDHVHAGFRHTVYPYRYEQARNWKGFCGGPRSRCNWLARGDILAALQHFGYTEIQTREESNHHGRAMSIVASLNSNDK